MAVSLTQLEEKVSACTEPSTHPTRDQVWQLAQLANSSEEALEIIQEKLFFRLTHPHQFHIHEVEHTLVVIQQCSFIAPLAFATYFKDRIYAIAALTNFRSTTASPSDLKTVNQKARKLFELLRNDVKLQEERRKCFVLWIPDGAGQTFPPPTPPTPGGARVPQNITTLLSTSRTPTHGEIRVPQNMAPLPPTSRTPTPGETRAPQNMAASSSLPTSRMPTGRTKAPQSVAASSSLPIRQTLTPGGTNVPQSTAAASSTLPTPRSSPLQHTSEIKSDENHDDHVPDNHSTDSISEPETLVELSAEEIVEQTVFAATANTPTEIMEEQMNTISSSTFDRYTLQVVISALLERLFVGAGQRTYHHLTKSLKIIDHCLRQGSPSFHRWFKDNRGLIGTLCTSPAVNAVNSLATVIFNRLDEEDTHDTHVPISGGQGPTREASPGVYPPTPVSTTSVISDSESIPLHEPVKDLTAFITNIDNYPFAHGGYSSVYKAKLCIGSLTEIVVKKVLISQGISRRQLEKRVNREIHIWTGLQHPNIASFYGITREDNGSIGLISPYFKHGNIVEYIKSKDKSQAYVLKMMKDITAGVSYLHGERIIHGDIKGSNVMVDDEGAAKLIDFGVSRITSEHGYTTSGSGASWAWAAPELVPYDDIAVAKTIYSDIWALALTFLELMTGRPPYGGLRLGGILAKFQQRAYPDRPSRYEECYLYPEDRLWALLLCCWDYTPENRPAIGTIQGVLEELLDVSGM